ncbi:MULTISPECIES: flavin reductase family protein [Enterobacter]|jgi:flavin reductase (DIM6/NTAB) family NADH-FMN oxidoreductase RutF|uniref:Asp/Glu/hydantoin racemase n=2 Tax=Enterobacter kobei TaxID=208224 RepID=A0ACC8SAD0_9ENTR|nr:MULTISPECIES: flavin reductase family protein [Enterobacter]MBV7403793.1 flavin reductase family protein [Enterobacter sp. ENT03]MDF3006509.1 Asp/Glu/hydantoin racemase [Enterobacter kobei]OLR20391.1 Asp/Glu/hydantoin racemase [Enterobacter kobei]WNP33268.1 flavin reductase family protein [Enterobacter kobei]SIQ43828.1 NADH-FMN oxidoreductase RutF, flavin reductase (DIM6/NTAB) family [Enterobacter kobei]
MYFYQPAQGHGLPHDPLNAIIGPRPIGWIASQDSQGQRNLAPYSFFNCFNYRPPIIGFSSTGWKDSVRNITETKEFVWNLTTYDLAVRMNESSASLPHGEDEFVRAGLTPVASQVVSVPRVAESPVNFECRLSQCIQLTAADGTPIDSWLVLGEVVGIHIDESLLENGIYQTAKARPVLRAGGPSAYYTIDESQRFDLVRPDAR